MPARLRLYDMRLTRLHQAVGLCQNDVRGIAQFVNSAQERLLKCPEAGDESWQGTWAEIAFNVSRGQPYITLPREIARLEAVTICDRVIPLNNQFFEYLQFGNGRLPKNCLQCDGWFGTQGLARNNAVTFVDLSSAPQGVRIYPTSETDEGKRVLLQGIDNNGNAIYSQDGRNQVTGIFVTLQSPFVDAPIQFRNITGIQKDQTLNPIRIVQVDPTSGAEVDLLSMEPTELVSGYRRYYLSNLPCWCCPPSTGTTVCPPEVGQTITARAIAKLDLIPVQVDTDWLLLTNSEAVIEEAKAVRYGDIDTPAAKQMETYHHKRAVGLLNGELTHYQGKNSPAINFAPFGSARLAYQKVGTLI